MELEGIGENILALLIRYKGKIIKKLQIIYWNVLCESSEKESVS